MLPPNKRFHPQEKRVASDRDRAGTLTDFPPRYMQTKNTCKSACNGKKKKTHTGTKLHVCDALPKKPKPKAMRRHTVILIVSKTLIVVYQKPLTSKTTRATLQSKKATAVFSG